MKLKAEILQISKIVESELLIGDPKGAVTYQVALSFKELPKLTVGDCFVLQDDKNGKK